MARNLTQQQINALRAHFIARQHELLALTCAFVETESPSGDKEASSAIASLIASAAATISAVDSIERIASDEFGEHIRIRAFAKENESAPIIILGHTD